MAAPNPMGNIISEFKRVSIAPEPEIVINRYNERNQLISKNVLDELGATVDVFTSQYDNRGNLVTVSDSSDYVTGLFLEIKDVIN